MIEADEIHRGWSQLEPSRRGWKRLLDYPIELFASNLSNLVTLSSRAGHLKLWLELYVLDKVEWRGVVVDSD